MILFRSVALLAASYMLDYMFKYVCLRVLRFYHDRSGLPEKKPPVSAVTQATENDR